MATALTLLLVSAIVYMFTLNPNTAPNGAKRISQLGHAADYFGTVLEHG